MLDIDIGVNYNIEMRIYKVWGGQQLSKTSVTAQHRNVRQIRKD